MNYYIDFDNTLYNTPLLTEKMLRAISSNARAQKNIKIFDECKSMFNKENIYDIYELAKYFSNKYSLNFEKNVSDINNIILNGEDLVFEDSIPFLQKLHNQNHNIYLLSYANENLNYQSLKIAGSGLTNYFDALFITSKPKYELDINYTNGIFIDDNLEDLLGLYSKNAKKVIRLRRKENEHSIQNTKNVSIEEYSSFDQIGG